MPPVVTVVVPTLDRPAMVRLAVASALAQRGVELEIVVVDDGSYPALDRRALPPDARITVARHEASRGDAAARNTGLERARAPWVAFLDDDDAWAPDKLRRQLDAARRRDAQVAYSGVLAVARSGAVLARLCAPPPEGLAERLLQRNAIPAGASNVVVRTDLVRDVGGFDESLSHLADWDLWIRLAAAGRAAAVDEHAVAYRYHPGNRSFSAASALRDDFAALADRYADRRRELGVALDRVDFERFLAWGPRHEGRRLAAARTYLSAAARFRDPGSAVRAAGVLLGERAMRAGSQRRPAEPLPAWAEPYVGVSA